MTEKIKMIGVDVTFTVLCILYMAYRQITGDAHGDYAC